MNDPASVAIQETQVSIRLPHELLDRAERLIERLRDDPMLKVLGVTRAAVLRLAVVRGLEALELERGGGQVAEPKAQKGKR
jgi:hypothetical protein